jgi:MFS family permease
VNRPAEFLPEPEARASNAHTVRWLLATDLVFNAAFYAVLPYLARTLLERGFSGAWIGAVVALRNLSQQGLYVIGGSIADRGDYKRTILWGCALRAAAFAGFAFAETQLAFAAASAATGVASALFAPALKAYLAEVARDERSEAFARSATWSQAGAILGPLAGLGLLWVGGFRWAAGVAGFAFAAWGAVLAKHLRSCSRAEPSRHSFWRQLRHTLRHGYFLAFSAALSGYAVLFSQLYLALPVAMGSALGAGGAFALSGLLVVLFQTRTTAWCRTRVSPGTAMVAGLGVMGLSFVPLAAAAALQSQAALAIGAWCTAALLTVGMMFVFPFAMSAVPALAGEHRSGTYFGVFYLFAGIAAAGSNVVVGRALEAGGAGSPGLWLALAAIGGASAAALLGLDRMRPCALR